MNLKNMIIESFEQIEKEGLIEKAVKANIEKTINGIFANALWEYSDFGKLLKQKIEESLNINLNNLSLPEYNQVLLDVIKAKFEATIRDEGFKKIEADIEKMITGDKKDWKLSELVEELKNDCVEEAGDNNWRNISLHIEKYSRLTFITIDPEPKKDTYQCKYKITIKNKEGIVTECKTESFDSGKRFFLGELSGFERLLFKLYAQKVKIEIDEDEIDTDYNLESEDD